MDSQEKFLLPIRTICGKFLTTDSINDTSEELLKLAKKAEFYSFNSFKVLIELLAGNPTLNELNVKGIFKTLQLLFELVEVKNKKSLLVMVYNFTIKCNENTTEALTMELLKFWTLKGQITAEKVSIYLTITSLMMKLPKIYKNKEYRNVISSNYRFIMESNISDDNEQKTLFQSICNTAVFCYRIEKNWTITIEFLEETVYAGFKTSNIKIQSDEIFIEYLNFIESSVYYEDAEKFKVCCKIVEVAEKILTNKEHILLNNVLHKCLIMFTNSIISECSIADIYQNYYKDVKLSSKNSIQLKVVQIVGRQLIKQIDKLSATEKCFLICHELVFKLFNLIKYIKDREDNFQKCCTDIKRHLIFTLSLAMVQYADRLINNGIFNRKIEKFLQYYIDYTCVLYKDLSCPSKQQQLNQLTSSLELITRTLFEKSSLMQSNINIMAQTYRTLVMYEEMKEMKDSRKVVACIGILLVNVTYDKTDENVKIYADAMLYPIILGLKGSGDIFDHKIKMKLIYALHGAVKILKYSCVNDFVIQKCENSELAKLSKDVDFEELMILELESVCRYDFQNTAELTMLFQKITENVNNPSYLARACLSITDKIIKIVGLEKIKDLNERMEKHAARKRDVHLLYALASNNYFISFIEGENFERDLKNTTDEILDCLSLENELKFVKFLDNFMDYAMEMLFCIRENPEQLNKISSMKILLTMLDNVATQYFVRGIANKDLEAKLLLWHFLEFCDNRDMLIDTASFFIDNHSRLISNSGHYICISKRLNYLRIEDIIPKVAEILESMLENIESKPENKQVRPLNYMISLWSYYITNGRRADGLKIWERYESARKVCSLENPLYTGTIEAKKLVALFEINLKCFRRNAVDHLYNAIILLQKIKTIYSDYSNNFHFIYRTLIVKVINYSLNRMVDIEYFSSAMLTIKNQAIKKGLFFKTLELFSLSTFRNLNMEKLDDAKADLKKMTQLLRLEDNILIETPISLKEPVHKTNFEDHDLTIRKAIPKLSSRKSVIEIFNDSLNNRNELLEQIQAFVHEYSCKCSMCKYPQLKFLLFQMGCHYSRLFYLMNRFDISKEFNEHALEPWRYSSTKVLRTKECVPFSINKGDFVSFSIRWLFQVEDTLMMIGKHSDVEEIHTELELLCTSNIEDYECIKQLLHARMQSLELIVNHKKLFANESLLNQLNFDDFVKTKSKSPHAAISITKSSKTTKKTDTENKKIASTKSVSQSAPSKLSSHSSKIKQVESVIYIDSDESDDVKSRSATAKTVRITRGTKPKATSQHVDIAHETPRTRLKRC